MAKNSFTHKDVLRIYPDLQSRTLLSWVEKGLLKPPIVEGIGRGGRRAAYSYSDLIEIGIIRELAASSIPLSWIKGFLISKQFRSFFDNGIYNLVIFFGFKIVRAIAHSGTPQAQVAGVRSTPLVVYCEPSNDFKMPDPGYFSRVILIHVGYIRRFVDQGTP